MKGNIKIIIGILIGIIISGITVFASSQIYANQISYGSGTVADALNYLYSRVDNVSNQSAVDTTVNLLNGANTYSVNKGLVPVLSSNTGSNGVAFCNDKVYSDYSCYKAFNNELSGADHYNWASYVLEGNYGYIGYQFNEATSANMFYVNTKKSDNNNGVVMTEFTLQGSNDGVNWTNLTSTINQGAGKAIYYKITNPGSYTYYRLYGKSAGAYSLIALHEFQLFNVTD